jgi:hypothetical protein
MHDPKNHVSHPRPVAPKMGRADLCYFVFKHAEKFKISHHTIKSGNTKQTHDKLCCLCHMQS